MTIEYMMLWDPPIPKNFLFFEEDPWGFFTVYEL